MFAALLTGKNQEHREAERGDASTEFVMVGALLVLLTMAILQVSFALYTRTMLVDAAAAGARYGTMRDRTPQEGYPTDDPGSPTRLLCTGCVLSGKPRCNGCTYPRDDGEVAASGIGTLGISGIY